jgi:hypothetical protein
MPDLIAISQGINAAKAAIEIAKTMVGLRDSGKLLENSIDLNQKILSVQAALYEAQSEQATLVRTIRELEEEIANMKAWDAEKERYELKEVAARTFAYALKPDASGSEPSHLICATCYQQNQKSILQGSQWYGGGWVHKCPLCKTQITTDFPPFR